jgi:hypothetical protein
MSIPELDLAQMDASKLVLVLAGAGLTNEEVAIAIGMTPNNFRKALDKNPDFKEIFDAAKEDPNHKVEQSLYKRALGYQTREIVQKAGKPVQVTIKEFAPDPVSCIFWLKNRSPKRWRDVVEHKHTLADRMSRAHEAIAERGRLSLTSGDGNEVGT